MLLQKGGAFGLSLLLTVVRLLTLTLIIAKLARSACGSVVELCTAIQTSGHILLWLFPNLGFAHSWNRKLE
ncbi:hypothetical protein KSZ_62590 [Dictyobacter formicarum]|uniref:Secreted protein n=2 Tax=Dictyobacter formicarum TaxID=2778368 RepID=A0ABQ3VRB2_9CHLR|nr:hypothetical protein KSZ_61390 [Dictyobacter formicarum]GHO88253.1 hypothetical protein KSZ_62590 [Dictyobacter formicarum]